MGAWGAGSFENDTALDWAATVESADDVRRPFERLKNDTDAAPQDPAPMLDADFACELIAAAETVAMMMGRRIPAFPEELAAKLDGAGKPDDLLYHQARNAVLHVLRFSELAELWEESVEDGGENEWHGEITGLVDRLNPDIEFTPWTQEEAMPFVAQAATACAFCNEPLTYENAIGLDIHDYSDAMAFNPLLLAHLACLNKRLHHAHVIHNMKHDPDNPPDLDKL
jgi:hypothetical protein